MKYILHLVVLSIVLASCSPCKRLARKCPPQIITEVKDSVVYRDTIIYRDRILEIKIPGDTVIVEKTVPVKEDIFPIRAENDYATASAWVESSKLKLELIQKEQVIKQILQNAEKETIYWKEKYQNEKQTVIIKEKYIPKIYKVGLVVALCLIVIIGAGLYIKIKGSFITRLLNRR